MFRVSVNYSTMIDHDQRFKILLKEFFPEFLQLFFPQVAGGFDFSKVVWLDKEVFTDPPQGERRALDLVAELTVLEAVSGHKPEEADHWVALVHVEIESADSVEPLRSRMYHYYEQLRRRHGRPVLPIAVYMRVGLDGIGADVYEEYFWELPLLRFEYLYVGLPALKAEQYLAGENLLGVALSALMKAPPERKVIVTAEGLRRLVRSTENDWRRFLLGEFLTAYSSLDEKQK